MKQAKECEKSLPEILDEFDCNIRFASHRGSGKFGKIPENTLPAFKHAAKKGIQVNELDVRISKDQIPIIFHGPWLNKTTSGKGLVEHVDYKNLKKLDWGYYLNPSDESKKKYASILTLDKYLEKFGKKCYTNLELKKSVFDFNYNLEKKTIQLVKKYELENRVFFSSFNLFSLLRLKKIAPDCARGLLISSMVFHETFANFIRKIIQPHSVHIHAKILNKTKIKKWKNRGYYLVTWGENSPKKLQSFFEWGIDLAIIDDLTVPKKLS